MAATEHYDEAYFAWQRRTGLFSAKANRYKFQPYIRATDRVVDFGCGGGYLLAALQCGERKGVEVNPVARDAAMKNGIAAVGSPAELPDAWADVIISNSALEHCEHPLMELRALLPKVTPGGRLVFVVPHETLEWPYKPGDINQHLYTWSPMGLGNLVKTAGFLVESVSASRFMWPPKPELFYKLGEPLFLLICRLYRWTRLALSWLKPVDIHSAVIVVARRP